MLRWAIEWNQNGELDGKGKHFIADGCNYHLFRTKKEAKEFIREHYGYIANGEICELRPIIGGCPKQSK